MAKVVMLVVSLLSLLSGAAGEVVSCLTHEDCPVMGQRCIQDDSDAHPRLYDQEFESDDPGCADGSVPCMCMDGPDVSKSGRRLSAPAVGTYRMCHIGQDCDAYESVTANRVCLDFVTDAPCAPPASCVCAGGGRSAPQTCVANEDCLTGEECFHSTNGGQLCTDGAFCKCAMSLPVQETLECQTGGDTCSGNECCAGVAASGSLDFACPSADPFFSDCDVNAPYIPELCSTAADCSGGSTCFDMILMGWLVENESCTSSSCLCVGHWDSLEPCETNAECNALGLGQCIVVDGNRVLVANEACEDSLNGCYCFGKPTRKLCEVASDCTDGTYCVVERTDMTINGSDSCPDGDTCICGSLWNAADSCEDNLNCAMNESEVCVDWAAMRALRENETCSASTGCLCASQDIPCSSSESCTDGDICFDDHAILPFDDGGICSAPGMCRCRAMQLEVEMCEDHSECENGYACFDVDTKMFLLENETCNATSGCLCGATLPCNSSLDCTEREYCYDTASNLYIQEGYDCEGDCICLTAFIESELCGDQSDCSGGLTCIDADTYMVILHNESCAEGAICFCGELPGCNASSDCGPNEFCFNMADKWHLQEDDICDGGCVCVQSWSERMRCIINADCNESNATCFDAMTMAMLTDEEACGEDTECYCGLTKSCESTTDCFESEYCLDSDLGMLVGDGVCSGGNCVCTRGALEVELCNDNSECDNESRACFDSATRMMLMATETCASADTCFCGPKASPCSSGLDCTEGEFCYDMQMDSLVREDDSCFGECWCLSAYDNVEACNSHQDCELLGKICYETNRTDGELSALYLDNECGADNFCVCGSKHVCNSTSDCGAGEFCFNETSQMPAFEGEACDEGRCYCDMNFAEVQQCNFHADCTYSDDIACFNMESWERLDDENSACPTNSTCFCYEFFWPTSTTTTTSSTSSSSTTTSSVTSTTSSTLTVTSTTSSTSTVTSTTSSTSTVTSTTSTSATLTSTTGSTSTTSVTITMTTSTMTMSSTSTLSTTTITTSSMTPTTTTMTTTTTSTSTSSSSAGIGAAEQGKDRNADNASLLNGDNSNNRNGDLKSQSSGSGAGESDMVAANIKIGESDSASMALAAGIAGLVSICCIGVTAVRMMGRKKAAPGDIYLAPPELRPAYSKAGSFWDMSRSSSRLDKE